MKQHPHFILVKWKDAILDQLLSYNAKPVFCETYRYIWEQKDVQDTDMIDSIARCITEMEMSK
jgi:hypothetical protein